MIHDIDIVLWLVKSKVKNIQANGVAVLTDTIDIANARITLKIMLWLILLLRISMRQLRKMRIFQKNAYFSIDFAENELECYQLVDKDDNQKFGFEIGYNNKKIILEKPTITDSNAIAEEQLLFAESILESKPVAVSAEDAANALHIAEEISKQVEASKVV
jgi:predicted dehydrogenase